MQTPTGRLRRLWIVAVVTVSLTSARATSVRPPSFSELVAQADCIVQVETQSVRSEWRGAGSSRHIVTVVTASVREPLVGKAPATIELEFLGGTVGGETLRVVDQPRLAPGDRDILFVQNNGSQICPLVSMMYGRYRLVRDPADSQHEWVARENGERLRSVEDISRPLSDSRSMTSTGTKQQGMTVASFEATIKQTATELGRKDVVP
jgi:hypothetical protein